MEGEEESKGQSDKYKKRARAGGREDRKEKEWERVGSKKNGHAGRKGGNAWKGKDGKKRVRGRKQIREKRGTAETERDGREG
jgi:hypothetical protein